MAPARAAPDRPADRARTIGDAVNGARRLATVLTVAATMVLAGCQWPPWRRQAEVLEPDEEFPAAVAVKPEPTAPAAQVTSRPAGPTTAPNRVRGAEVVEAGILQVNDKYITLQEVLGPIRGRLAAAAREGDEAAFRRKAAVLIAREVRMQIERTLLLAEARKDISEEGMKLIGKEVEKRFRRAVAEAGGSRTAFAERLREHQSDLETWTRDQREGLMIQAYLQRHLGSEVRVTRRMMRNHYEANAKRFRTEDRVRIQAVSSPVKAFLPALGSGDSAAMKQARRKARELIDKAAAELASGKDFAEVARKHSRGPMASEGGVWPEMPLGSLRDAKLEALAFAQRPGQVSGVVETPEGFYIVKTLARTEGRQLPFEKVQGKIEIELRQQEYDRLAREYFDKLRANATVVADDRFQRVAAELAVRQFFRR